MGNANILQSYLKTPFLVLLGIEVCIIFFSVYLAAFLWFYVVPDKFAEILPELWHGASVIAIITPISMLATGLYQGQIREGLAGNLLRIGIGFMASSVIVTVIFYLNPDIFLDRGVLGLTFVLSFFMIGTLRAIFLESVDTNAFKKRVLVYGAGETATHIDNKLRRKSDRRGFDIVGYALIENQICKVPQGKLVKIEGTLLNYALDKRIDEIVVATSEMKQAINVDELVNCKLNGINVTDILSFFEREAGQIRIDIIDPKWLVTSEGFRQSQVQDVIKRLFDIMVSLVVLLIALPFLILTVLAIWIEDGIRAPVFYSQTRIGKRGVPYKVYKFRSMRVNAEKSGEAIWASKDDARITRVGKIIRVTRLDEFPQILNVLNGTMSFVGPRPERPQFVEELSKEIPFYSERHLVKPGVTGWAQLLYPYGSSINDSYQKQLFDMYYVKNHSIFLDCLILLQTVEVILFGKGAR